MKTQKQKDRYERIRKVINSPKTRGYLMLIVEIIEEVFKPFLVLFQTKETLIHLVYDSLGDLVFKLMSKIFLTAELVAGSRKSMDELLDMDLDQLPKLDMVDKSLRATKYFDTVKSEHVLSMEKSFRGFVLATLNHLKKTLPRHNDFLMSVSCINPHKLQTDDTFSIVKLAEILIKKVIRESTSVHYIFRVEPEKTRNDIIDCIKLQYKFLCIDKLAQDGQSAVSYWEDVALVKDEVDMKPKYQQLVILAIMCLTVNHANAIPERGFSVNSYIAAEDRASLTDDTIIALRLVYDYLQQFQKVTDFPITAQLVKLVQLSHSKYRENLRELEEARKKREDKLHRNAIKEKDVAELGNKKDEIRKLQLKIEVFEEMIEAGNQELQNAMKMKTTSKQYTNKIEKASTKLEQAISGKKRIAAKLKTAENEMEALKKKRIILLQLLLRCK
jgi:hypothetical protein